LLAAVIVVTIAVMTVHGLGRKEVTSADLAAMTVVDRKTATLYGLELWTDAKTTSLESAKFPIKIGYDTTRISGPRRADGTVDYLAAFDQQCSRGVTKDNNAAVLIAQAIGPTIFEEAVRSEGLRRLGVTLEPDGKYLDTSFKGDPKEYEAAKAGPWKPAGHAELAQWLTAD
jgi:hypothetical protein